MSSTQLNPDNTIGRRLRQVRHDHGWTLDEVAALSAGEFTRNALSNYERGERNLSVARLLRLASIYQVPASELLPAEPVPADPNQLVITEPAGRPLIDVFAELDVPDESESQFTERAVADLWAKAGWDQ